MVLKPSHLRWIGFAVVVGAVAPNAWGESQGDMATLYFQALNQEVTNWTEAIAGIGRGLAFWVFRTLAVLQFTFYFCLQMVKGKMSLVDFMADFVTRFFWLGLLWAVVNWWGGLGGLPQEFFILTGQVLTGIEGMDPLEMTDQAMSTFLTLFLDEKLAVSFIAGGQGFVFIVIAIVMVSYVLIVLRQTQILTKSMYLYGIGALFLAFGVWERTASLADGWVRCATKAGLELMGLSVGVSLGAAVAHEWIVAWDQLTIFDLYGQMLLLARFAIGMALWATVVLSLPAISASIADNFNIGFPELARLRV